MISMTYLCTQCEFKTGVLNDAQEHANATTHSVEINGFITTNKVVGDFVRIETSQKIKDHARELEIMRRAREKGLVR